MATPQWKLDLQPASYNGVMFHVDVNTRASGRRIANHEYPKRDTPYAEDMGSKSRRFTVTGSMIGSTSTDDRDALIYQFELTGPGQLVLPTGMQNIGTGLVTIENYSVSERRERGGIATFEMMFLEFGVNTATINNPDTQGQVTSSVDSAMAGPTTDTANQYMNPASVSITGASPTSFTSWSFPTG